MNKNDLKSGFCIELRNNDRYIVMRDAETVNQNAPYILIPENGIRKSVLYFADFDSDTLEHKELETMDIMKVSKYNYHESYFSDMAAPVDRNILWERKEIEEEMVVVGGKEFSVSTINTALKQYIGD